MLLLELPVNFLVLVVLEPRQTRDMDARRKATGFRSAHGEGDHVEDVEDIEDIRMCKTDQQSPRKSKPRR